MSTRVLVCTLLALGALATACSDEDEPPAPVEASALPDDLCVVVPTTLQDTWKLGTPLPAHTEQDGLATTTCTMSGTYLGSPLTLELRLTSFGGADAARARLAMTAHLEAECAVLGTTTSATAQVAIDANDCSLREPSGSVVQVARSLEATGVARVEVTYDGENPSGVAAEAERLVDVLTSDPADLR